MITHPCRKLHLSFSCTWFAVLTKVLLGFWATSIAFVGLAYCQQGQMSTEASGAPSPFAAAFARTSPLDRPIDPQSYLIGPGDQLTIFIWGNVQAQYELLVSPEGKLLIPTIGPVNVAGMNLAEAKDTIAARILERYRNVQVTTDLSGLRRFKVYCGGAVKNPGTYVADPLTRISEIITMAGGFVGETDPSAIWNKSAERLTPPPGIASHRHIVVTHADGSVDTADILGFEIFGDLERNLRVMDGDRIFVPLRDSSVYLCGVFGGVKNPGYFEYSSRDSLRYLLKMAHGLAADADSVSAELVRFDADAKTTTTIEIPLREILLGLVPDIHLMPDDRVYVKVLSDYHEKHQVLILGQVRYPGFYSIRPESTYLSSIIQAAGGVTSLASLVEAEMIRFVSEEAKDREFERLKTMQVKDMSDLEYEYFKIKSRQKPGRVAVDFEKLLAGHKSSDIVLRDGDMILIPKIHQVVNVAGEVANPGLVGYHPDYDYLDYIELAGGCSFRANKSQIRVIRGATGEWQKPKRHKGLDPGDTILVPEKKRINYLTSLRDAVLVIGNLATVYLVVREATR